MSPLNSRKVSILSPVYNSARFLPAMVESVQAQTHSHWELLLVIDPGSSDHSERVALAYSALDPRIRVLHSPTRGVAAARNFGIQNASGEYLAFLDSDDAWLSVKLERQLRFMYAMGARFSCTAFRRVNEAGTRLGRRIRVPRKISYFRLLQQNCILCSSVMVERSLLAPFQFLDLGCEDFALWLSLVRSGTPCFGYPQDLVRYRIVSGSRGSRKLRSLRETWNIYRHVEKLSLSKALATLLPFVLRGAGKYAWF